MIVGKLGLRRGDPTRPALRLGPALTGQVPAHPASADNASRIPDWGMLGNDAAGDCGPAGVLHQRMQVTTYLTATPYIATTAEAIAFYQQCCPEYDPATGAGDDGVVLQDMLDVAAHVAVEGVAPVAYARVDHTNLDEVRAAIALFGSVLFGVDLDNAQQTQQVWDYVPGTGDWGGHCVLGVAYTDAPSGADVGVVTWGEVVATTDAFLAHQLQEAWAVIWPEHLGSAEFVAGVDLTVFAADFEAITGRPLPVPTPPPAPAPPAPPTPPAPPAPAPPGPVTPPPVDPADAALVTALDPWAAEHHVGPNAHAKAAYLRWRTAKGYALLEAGEYVVPLNPAG